MPLPTPNLDDRNFEQLLNEAKARIHQTCPQWELSESDPATVLLQAHAYLTEVMLYRLNRVPEKAYIEFLNLLGLRMQPPTAASVELTFTRARASDSAIEIPRGSRVTVSKPTGSENPPLFVTVRSARIEPGQTEINATACDAEYVEAELLGYSTGKPRFSLKTKRAPIIEATIDAVQLIVGVETSRSQLNDRVPSIKYKDKIFRIWTEVDTFSNLPPNTPAYIVDRTLGLITFAPAIRMKGADGLLLENPQMLAAIPEPKREVRAWYWYGGGSRGNVAPETLTALKDAIPGVSVTNRTRASGGRAAETLQNALGRGPQEFRSLERAVTASDYELLATRNGGVSRAKAFSVAQVWAHGVPGTVQVLIVPELPADVLNGPLESKQVAAYHTETSRLQIQKELDQRRLVATNVDVKWARHKNVQVNLRVVAYREEDAPALQQRVLQRLYQRLNPGTWQFGQPLRASHIYDMILAEPGVNYVENLSFQVDDVPHQDVPSLARDAFQRKTWHAACGDSVFRSMNDGESWERTGTFAGESASIIAAHPGKAGLLAVVTTLPGDGQQNAIYYSFDDGESWSAPTPVAFVIHGLAWTLRDTVPVLLMATSVGLYELALEGSRVPIQILVDPKQADHGFSAITAITDVRGITSVAIASEQNAGVFLSNEGGKASSFRPIGLANEDIRTLTVQYDGPRTFLWAGFGAAGNAPGSGAARIELLGSEVSADDWKRFTKDWKGGSCWSLAFRGLNVYAGSYQSGVLRLDASEADPSWKAPDLSSGLAQRGVERIFQLVKTVSAAPDNDVLLCGGPAGVYRSTDGGLSYQNISSPTYTDKLTLPETWLFCSGEHKIEVTQEHEKL